VLALFSTVMLMAGVVSLANASNILQVAFAAAYILLNIVYWAVSALNPATYHWDHAYDVEVLPLETLTAQGTDSTSPVGRVEELKKKLQHEWHRFQDAWILEKRRNRARKRAQTMIDPIARNFTGALWTAIVLTGTAQWLNEATAIAPVNEAWKQWLREADNKVQPKLSDGDLPGRHNDQWADTFKLHRRPRIQTGLKWTFTPATKMGARAAAHQRWIKMKEWEYQKRLTEILKQHAEKTRVQLDDEVVGAEDTTKVSGSEKDPSTPGVLEEV
jgi:hypothetical protein